MLSPTGFPCPVCGTPATGPATAPCPTCGLPAAGQAALVVARIGATLDELARDRNALLATLRAQASPVPVPAPVPAPGPAPAPPWSAPVAPGPVAPGAVGPAGDEPPRAVSPQQVLLGLGALLLVAGALAFVAVAWTRFGLAFQAAVMLVVTATAGALSAWSGRRGLRATEEALAAAAAALLAVDLGAAHAKGLGGIDQIEPRLWAAVACGALMAAGLGLGRLTRTTVTWPLAALLAAQPIGFLLLPPDEVTGPAGVGVALLLAGVNLVARWRLRPGLAPVSEVLAVLAAALGAVGALAVAAEGDLLRSGLAAAAVAAAGAAAGGYAVATGGRRPKVVAVAAFVVAAWTALGGAEVTTPEAYALPAAAGLLVLALPGLRGGRPSWAGEGTAIGVALLPSAVLAVNSPTVPRLVLVVAAATAATVAGTLTHRQAPFVLGAVALALVVIGRVVPYASLLPRWVALTAAGLVLLVVGATYERRRRQASEAVAWVAQMR